MIRSCSKDINNFYLHNTFVYLSIYTLKLCAIKDSAISGLGCICCSFLVRMGNIKKRLSFFGRTIIKDTMPNPSLLRQFWKAVSEISYSTLLSLPDLDLSQIIIQKVRDQIILNAEEAQDLDRYLNSRLLLIRDLAHSL
jgi:hypothetical protein